MKITQSLRKWKHDLTGEDLIKKLESIEWVSPEGEHHEKAYSYEFERTRYLFQLATLKLERIKIILGIVKGITIISILAWIYWRLDSWNVPSAILNGLRG